MGNHFLSLCGFPPDAPVSPSVRNMYPRLVQSVSQTKCTDESLDLVPSGCPLLLRRRWIKDFCVDGDVYVTNKVFSSPNLCQSYKLVTEITAQTCQN